MKLTTKQFKALQGYVNKKVSTRGLPAFYNQYILPLDPKKGNADLKEIGKERLETLLAALPHGLGNSIFQRTLLEVKRAIRSSIAGMRAPHLDPGGYPQIWRMQTKINNSRAGIIYMGAGQYGKLNDRALSIPAPLRGTHRWNGTNSGDLHVMGTWQEISTAIAGATFEQAFGNYMMGNVDFEFDRMHGDAKTQKELDRISVLNLHVSLHDGAIFAKTDEEGEVLLNAPGEIVELVGSKVTGLAGAVGPEGYGNKVLDTLGDVKGHIEDHVIPVVQKGMEVRDYVREQKLKKTMKTLTIGIGPFGRRTVEGKESMTGSEVLALAQRL